MIWLSLVVATAIVNLVIADLAGWLPRVAERLIRFAAQLLPGCDHLRYEAEWLGELDVLPGRGISAVVFAFRLLVRARGVGRELSDHGVAETRPRSRRRAPSEHEKAHVEALQRLSMAVEFREADANGHIERTGRFSTLLAERIGMDSDFCERLRHAAPLHDVGKVAIPDAILLKPGPLTPEERVILETHAEEGHRLMHGASSPILGMAATIALSHQEKWDGSGFPRGLKGEAIPIEGRIVAIADVFDALTSDRVYRKAFSVKQAVQMMSEQRSRHFDPAVLDSFLEVLAAPPNHNQV
jgi:HD-GYP domain-containing protein (c-di-GMP phosphodiesterase class II)